MVVRVREPIVMKTGARGTKTALGNRGRTLNGNDESGEEDQQRTHGGFSQDGVEDAGQS